MKTTATVIATDGEYATVETERTSACDGCHKSAEGGCSVCSLMASGRKLSVRAANPLHAAVGDRVTVESSTGRMLRYAALVFLLPLLLMLAGWGIAAAFDATAGIQALAGLGGFVVAFAIVYIYAAAVRKKRCDVEITGILKKGEEPPGMEDAFRRDAD